MDSSFGSAVPNDAHMRQSLVLDFGAKLLHRRPAEEIWRRAAATIAAGSGAAHSRVMRYRGETGDMEVCAGFGWSPDIIGSSLSLTSTPAGRSFRTGVPVLVRDITTDLRFEPDELLRRHGIVSLLNVPVTVGGSICGALEIEGDSQGQFSADSLSFLQSIALLVGLALMHERAVSDAGVAARRAAASAAESALLLHEQRHRTGNNLQAIMAMLNIEVRATEHPATLDALRRVIARVNSIGKAEASLAAAAQGRNADLRVFLSELCSSLAMPPGVRLTTNLAPVRTERGTAVPIGLIVNEAVTNCLKHAFQESHGTITVTLRPVSETRARVSIRDDGIGLLANWRAGSGTTIMNALAYGLGATIMRTAGAGAGGGTAVVVEFAAEAALASKPADQLVSLTALPGEEMREGDE